MDVACVPHLEHIMQLCDEKGVSAVVRAIPDPRRDIGLQIMSYFHYGPEVRISPATAWRKRRRSWRGKLIIRRPIHPSDEQPDHVFTLGIEEEFQIVDPETRELRSQVQQILDDGKITLKEHVKAEMHQSVVELGTEICTDVQCAREQVTQLRTELAHLAGHRGLLIASAGTHPFSHWMDQLITPANATRRS